MVSQDTQTNLHHFLNCSHISTQPHFDNNPHFNPNPYSNPNQNPYFSTTTTTNTSVESLGERMSRSIKLDNNNSNDDGMSEMGHTTRHFMDLLGGPNESNHGSSRLSLSLGSEFLQVSNEAMQQLRQRSEFLQQGFSNDYVSFPGYGVGNSVYLKPTQAVLEEVVDLGSKSIELSQVKRVFLSCTSVCNELRAEMLSNGLFSLSDKHDLHIKLSQLISLLEQVEGRYDEYFQRMEDLVSSFEVVAGEGAAKCYTALALQAMCKHFCNLRNAILTQIKLVRKKLSPELPNLGSGLSSRLTLQQIGLIQGAHRQAWRPIRGLPETSVAILRAWLFEHFLHPYPNDAEKLTLSSQTGLSKNQVSNWFINARVRLWKPMIEEMYKEEFGDSSVDSSGDCATDRAEE